MATPTFWHLNGGGITMDYDSSGGGVFILIGLGPPATFAGGQIRVVPTPDLNMLVSVTAHVFPFGETRFTVLLPLVEVDAAHPVAVIHTEGITTHITPLVPHGQKEHYTVTALSGQAS
jgi:hypothetical protein